MSSLVTCQMVEQAEGVGGVVAKVEFNSPERLNALTVDLAAGTTRTLTDMILYLLTFVFSELLAR